MLLFVIIVCVVSNNKNIYNNIEPGQDDYIVNVSVYEGGGRRNFLLEVAWLDHFNINLL